jgi:glyoxylase-like metal-dependent hydrolase (beta-lactamase superfamily II)
MKITQLVTGPLSVNTWCIELDPTRVIVVDPGGDADLIITHLADRGSEPALFLLTHGHFDHLIALPSLAKRWPSVPIAIHPADGSWVGPGALRRHHALFTDLGAGAVVERYSDEIPPATVFLEDDKPIFIPDSAGSSPSGVAIPGWKVLHTPGHSPGSVCLYHEGDGILIAGDTLFNAGYGRTDLEGGNVDDLFRSIQRLFALPARTLVFPGHGERTTIGREAGAS